MALNFPWGEFLEAQKMKNQNQQNMYGNISGIGQGLGQGLGAIGEAIQEHKKQKMVEQLVQLMKTQGDPQQGPQMPTGSAIQGPHGYAPPNQGAGSTTVPAGQFPMPQNPASGMGGPAQDNTQQMQALMMQLDPQGMIKEMMDRQNPYKQALTQQALSEAEKNRRPPKPNMEWAPIPNFLSANNKPVFYDKTTHQQAEGDVPGKSTGYGMSMAPIRQAQYTIQDLPSNQGPNTAGGAAYQVKIGANQGKALIAKMGSPQRSAIAAADLVRSVTRVAPTDEAMQKANFSNNLVSQWATLKQKITANPEEVYNPKIRKEMYDIFTEMDKSATPFIENQLDDMADAGFPVTPATRKRQLGQTMPNIPFESGNVDQSTGTYSDPGKEARYQAWKKSQGL